jgi:hypothetical protein
MLQQRLRARKQRQFILQLDFCTLPAKGSLARDSGGRCSRDHRMEEGRGPQQEKAATAIFAILLLALSCKHAPRGTNHHPQASRSVSISSRLASSRVCNNPSERMKACHPLTETQLRRLAVGSLMKKGKACHALQHCC